LPQIKFDSLSTYKDEYRPFRVKTEQGERNPRVNKSSCIVEQLEVPPVNYINDQSHIFYDPEAGRFV
jgi:hypothetical protein